MRSTTWGRFSRVGAAAALVVLASCSTPAASPAPTSSAPTSSAPTSSAPTSSAPASSAPASSAPASSAAAGGADLSVADTALGPVVVDHEGRTAYYFDHDKAGSGASTCSGDCLVAWPAITPAGSTPTVEGVTAKVGTIKRDDGTAQITVAGRPVYLFVKDTAAGDVKGQGVGGVWYVVAADGTEVKKSAAS